MKKSFSRNRLLDLVLTITLLFDFIATVLALTFAITSHLGFSYGVQRLMDGNLIGYLVGGSLLHLILLHLFRGYDAHRMMRPNQTLILIFKVACVWLAVFLAFTTVLKFQIPISRRFFLWAFIYFVSLLSLWRLAFCGLLHFSTILHIIRDRVLIVGWSKESDAMAKHIAIDVGHPYEVIGCIPLSVGKFHIQPPDEIPILGEYGELLQIIKNQRPNTILLADLDPTTEEIFALAQLCIKEHVQFKIIPAYFQVFVSGLHLESISGIPVLGISKVPLDYFHNRIFKRLLDILGATIGLLLSAPIIAFFGLLIYCESPGPIFYSQTRCGRGGRVFRIYKLRSMKLNAEASGPQWTTENDPRRLKIGAFIRKWNIDELPQFWNVFKSDMSLVGPRPERPELIENFKEEIQHYNARHFSKCGLTGFAQINGMRGNTDLQARIQYDLYYIENWSIPLDVYILFRTFFAHSNAY